MVSLDGRSLTLESFRVVVRDNAEVSLAEAARGPIDESRRVVEDRLAGDDAVYGINTGFGDLASQRIPQSQTELLQERLIRSHAAGMGEPLGRQAVRGMLLLRANALAGGRSGIRRQVIELLISLLNHDILPVIPSRGSVGASGDLAPLAHLALPLTGRGRVDTPDGPKDSAAALADAGLEPVRLGAKEGLALINGTQASASLAAGGLLDAWELARTADLLGALSTEAIKGTDEPFDERIHATRPHAGQEASARNIWNLLQDSEIRESHRADDPRVQDPYSFRCMPQVHGAVRDVLSDVERRLVIEMNSVTDNPLVFAESGAILAGGNFHAQPVAFAADFLAITLCEIGSISERRIEKLNQANFSGLPPFLSPDPGINSGFMIPQVTAAALVAENRVLSHPASTDTIPTSADKEDHVSMSMGAALKLQQVVANVRRVLAIELLCAAQGIDLLRPLRSTAALERLHGDLRNHVAKLDEDREMAPDLALSEAFLAGPIRTHLEGLE